MKSRFVTSVIFAAGQHARSVAPNGEAIINGVAGFQNTPMAPGGKLHVHDPVRLQPSVVTPGATFSQYPCTHKRKHLMSYLMRADRHRCTRWVDRDDHSKVEVVELYDHQADPEENKNIANSPENARLLPNSPPSGRLAGKA